MTAIAFFCSPAHDGAALGRALAAAHPDAVVLGCTTAGEFDEHRTGTGGISAIGFPAAKVRRATAALADFEHGVDASIKAAVAHLEAQLGSSLRELDPERFVGLVLIDGVHGEEEAVNALLGNAAPLLSFVGGSAGDDLAFAETQVFHGEQRSAHGAVLAVLDMAVPFVVAKTCSFEPVGRSFEITKAEPERRIVWELDSRPAVEVYAEAVGVPVAALDASVFMKSPVGIMIDGEPWIRSPQQVVDGGGIKFYCEILEGMEVELVRSTDLVGETRHALEDARERLGGSAGGAVMFNCILRRLELDQTGQHEQFVAALGDQPVSGFHTYGESWLGHINQTLTALLVR